MDSAHGWLAGLRGGGEVRGGIAKLPACSVGKRDSKVPSILVLLEQGEEHWQIHPLINPVRTGTSFKKIEFAQEFCFHG